MTKPIAWMASNELLFSVVKDEIYHIPLYTHPMRELTMNPDILPTLEEWRLICKMVKHQREMSDDEIKQVYGKYFDAKNCDWLHLQCIREILERTGEK